jgi:hypothetical protein
MDMPEKKRDRLSQRPDKKLHLDYNRLKGGRQMSYCQNSNTMSVSQHLYRMEKIDVEFSGEIYTSGMTHRTIQIEGVTIFLTTEQALQIATAITDQLASEIEAESEAV